MMSKLKQAKKPVAKKPVAKPSKAKNFAKLFAAAVKDGETSFAASDADGASRVGFASHDRTDGKKEMSSKRQIFEYAVSILKKSGKLTVAQLEAYAKAKKLTSVQTGERIKPTTIASWLRNWRKASVANGSFFPCDSARKTEIEKLFAKLGK